VAAAGLSRFAAKQSEPARQRLTVYRTKPEMASTN